MSRRRLPQRDVRPSDIDYLDEMPTAVPAGRILVHNNVVPARRINTRGFRVWFASPEPNKFVVCECDWAPELGAHYRLNTEAR
jgi:hypothetical protein